MKKEIIYSSGNYLRDEFKIEGYLFGNKVKVRTSGMYCRSNAWK